MNSYRVVIHSGRIERCVEEQAACAASFRDESLPADERRGAWQGVCDWIMAEALYREVPDA